METTIPKDALSFVVGSDNPTLPNLILNLSKGDNETIHGTGYLVPASTENEVATHVQELLVKGAWASSGTNEVILTLNGFEENRKEPVVSIQLKLDNEWSNGTGSYRYVKAFLSHAQLSAKDEAVYPVRFMIIPQT